MKYLLDTAVFIWMVSDERDQFSRRGLALLEADSMLYLSTVSLWEIAIKFSSQKLYLDPHPQKWLPPLILKMGLVPLPISQDHALATIELPYHHRDPFDRLLVSQAKIESLPIISPDKIFRKYKVETIW